MLSMGPTSKYRTEQALDMSFAVNDWMRKVRAPIQYRVGSSVHINTPRLAKVGIVMLLVLTCLVLLLPVSDYDHKCHKRLLLHPKYNATYPLTSPEKTADGIKFRIGVITDLDTDSKSKDAKNTWISYYTKGYLTYNPNSMKVTVSWDEDVITLKSAMSQKDRGMELSELVAFNGKLYTCDDRTGIISEITDDNKILPWVVLGDGNGRVEKGTCEHIKLHECLKSCLDVNF